MLEKPALSHFQCIDHGGASAWNGCFVKGIHVMGLKDFAGGTDIRHGKRQRGVLHPESDWTRLWKDKKHPLVVVQVGAAHEPPFACGLIGGNLGGESIGAENERGFRKIQLGLGRRLKRKKACSQEEQQGGEERMSDHADHGSVKLRACLKSLLLARREELGGVSTDLPQTVV